MNGQEESNDFTERVKKTLDQSIKTIEAKDLAQLTKAWKLALKGIKE